MGIKQLYNHNLQKLPNEYGDVSVMKILENIQVSVNMIDRLDITDKYSVKCDFILNTVIFIDAALIFH